MPAELASLFTTVASVLLLLSSAAAMGQEIVDQPMNIGRLLMELTAAPDQARIGPGAGDFEVWQRRSKAVAELSAMGTNAWPAVPSLVGLASHSNLQITVAAATVLASIRAEEDPAWAELQHELLGQTNASQAFQFLVTGNDEFMRPYTPAQRRFGVIALGATGPAGKQAALALLPLFQSKAERDLDLWVPLAVACRKIGVGTGELTRVLKRCLQDANESIDVRVSAAHALAAAGSQDEETITFLRQELTDEHSHVRVAAARALWTLKEPAAEILPVLTPLLSHKLVSVRTAALLALSEMGDAASATKPAIQSLLTDPNPAVRNAAERALAKMSASPEGQITAGIASRAQSIPLPAKASIGIGASTFLAEGTFTSSESLSKAAFSFSFSNGWWEVELRDSDPANGGPIVQNCKRIPDGTRHYLLFKKAGEGLPSAVACPSPFPPPGLAGGMFECWLSLCPGAALPLIDAHRMHRFLKVPTCESELENDPRGKGGYRLTYLQPGNAFLSELSVTNNGYWVDLLPTGNLGFVRHGAPFENGGFPELTYQVIETTNVNGFTFPLRAAFKYTGPPFAKARENDRQTLLSEITVTQIRFSENQRPGEKIPAPLVQFATDYRQPNLPSASHTGIEYLGTTITNDHWEAISATSRIVRTLPTEHDLGSEWSREVAPLFDPARSEPEWMPWSEAVPYSFVKLRRSAAEEVDDPVVSWGHARFHVRTDHDTQLYEVQVQRYEDRERLRKDFGALLETAPADKDARNQPLEIGEGGLLFQDDSQKKMTVWFHDREFLVWVSPLGPGPHLPWDQNRWLQHLVWAIEERIARPPQS